MKLISHYVVKISVNQILWLMFFCMWWQYTDLEESSDWMVSSLEDRQEMSKPAQGSGPMRKSLDSPSTSVWGTSTGKGPKSGQLFRTCLYCIYVFWLIVFAFYLSSYFSIYYVYSCTPKHQGKFLVCKTEQKKWILLLRCDDGVGLHCILDFV